MRPVTYTFRLPRTGTPVLGIVLHGRDPRTGQVARLPVPGVTVAWTVDWPSGSETRTPFSVPDPLTVDRRTGAILFPISAAHADDLAGSVRPIATGIRLLMPDGFAVPVLNGSIVVED